jgi:hypothetical protein
VANFVDRKLPSELLPNTYYYVTTVASSTTFQVSASIGGSAISPVTFVTEFSVETNAYRVSYSVNVAKQFSFFAKSSNYNAMNSPFSLAVVPHRQCGTQSTVFGSGISSALFSSVTAFTIVARDFYGNRRTIANDQIVSGTPNDVYLASVIYSSVPSPAPWSYSAQNSVTTVVFTAPGSFPGADAFTTYTVQATTISGTGSGAVFSVKVDNSQHHLFQPVLLVGGYGYSSASGSASVLKLFKESFGSPPAGDITMTVSGVAFSAGLSAVMVTPPCISPVSPCRNAVPTSVGDGTYTGA